MAKTRLKLLSDQAVLERGSERKDGLGFNTYAKILGDAAIGTPGPFTIGVFGEWGTGKTSLLRLIKDYVDREDKKSVTVWFNAWKYEKEEHPIVPLIGTIINDLKRNQKFLANLQDAGKNLIKALTAIAYGFSAKAKVKVPGFAEIEASLIAKDIIDSTEKLTSDPLLDKSLYYQAFDRLDKLDLPPDNKIIIVIDDLDRCFPDSAIKLLESIKLILAQPNFIFVLGVARSVIEGYLLHKYQSDYGIKDYRGEAYLDKIVQLPFYIPPHEFRMSDFSNSLLTQLDDTLRDQLSEIIPVVPLVTGSNPRATVRFVNNLLIDKEINNALAKEKLMDLIEIEFFAISRALQQRWNFIFLKLFSSTQLCKILVEWIEKNFSETVITNAISKQTDTSIDQVVSSIRNNEELKVLLKSNSGINWLRDENKRKAAVQFLQSKRSEEFSSGSKMESASFMYLFLASDNKILDQLAGMFDEFLHYRIYLDESNSQFASEYELQLYYKDFKAAAQKVNEVFILINKESLSKITKNRFIKNLLQNSSDFLNLSLLLYDEVVPNLPAEFHNIPAISIDNLYKKLKSYEEYYRQ